MRSINILYSIFCLRCISTILYEYAIVMMTCNFDVVFGDSLNKLLNEYSSLWCYETLQGSGNLRWHLNCIYAIWILMFKMAIWSGRCLSNNVIFGYVYL